MRAVLRLLRSQFQDLWRGGGGGGILPDISHIGMFRPQGFGFGQFFKIYIVLFHPFVYFFIALIAVRINLPFYIFLQVSVFVLIQVYNWEIRHHSLVCCCDFADILNGLGMGFFGL